MTKIEEQLETQRQINTLLAQAAKLAYDKFGDKDIYNYGRAYEYLMAEKLGHSVSTTRSGQDGYNELNEGVEYKTNAYKGYNKQGTLKQHTFNYYGFSRCDTYEEQVQTATDKIMGSAKHYWGIKSEVGFDFHLIVEVESSVVLTAFLNQLQSVWKKAPSRKDPRINVALNFGDISNQYTVKYSEK
jgi:hypothetical protein